MQTHITSMNFLGLSVIFVLFSGTAFSQPLCSGLRQVRSFHRLGPIRGLRALWSRKGRCRLRWLCHDETRIHQAIVTLRPGFGSVGPQRVYEYNYTHVACKAPGNRTTGPCLIADIRGLCNRSERVEPEVSYPHEEALWFEPLCAGKKVVAGSIVARIGGIACSRRTAPCAVTFECRDENETVVVVDTGPMYQKRFYFKNVREGHLGTWNASHVACEGSDGTCVIREVRKSVCKQRSPSVYVNPICGPGSPYTQSRRRGTRVQEYLLNVFGALALSDPEGVRAIRTFQGCRVEFTCRYWGVAHAFGTRMELRRDTRVVRIKGELGPIYNFTHVGCAAGPDRICRVREIARLCRPEATTSAPPVGPTTTSVSPAPPVGPTTTSASAPSDDLFDEDSLSFFCVTAPAPGPAPCSDHVNWHSAYVGLIGGALAACMCLTLCAMWLHLRVWLGW